MFQKVLDDAVSNTIHKTPITLPTRGEDMWNNWWEDYMSCFAEVENLTTIARILSDDTLLKKQGFEFDAIRGATVVTYEEA